MKLRSKIIVPILATVLSAPVCGCNHQKTSGMTTKGEIHEKSLFDTTKICGMTLKNRFFRASVGDHSPDGSVNDRMLQRYCRLAEGGVGTIMTGYTLVDSCEKDMGIMGIYDDSFIAGNRRLTDSVHNRGANIVMQLVSVGSNFHSRVRPEKIMSASAVTNRNTGITPQEMTIEDIHDVTSKFATAAARAKAAGFDGVEIHGCHGYLLNQFLSPYYNRRTDQYGGSRENRSRIVIEIYEAIRETVGNEYPLFIKVQSEDGYEGGVGHDDCLYLCKELAKRGINAIEVSGNFQDYNQDNAYFESIADRIAHETGVPVIVTGGNRNFETMQAMIDSTAIDYVGMARPLIKDPDLINEFYKQYHEN